MTDVLLVLFLWEHPDELEVQTSLLHGESNCPAAEWKRTHIDLLLLFNGVLGNMMGRRLGGSTRLD